MEKFLFTTLPSDDLGLLMRSLPIARELRERSHEITFCSPGKTPSRLISEAGFNNLYPESPLLYIMSGDTKLRCFQQLLR
jgi:UDP:flavonoid glycosyltransferase YjiC (YdhE family)